MKPTLAILPVLSMLAVMPPAHATEAEFLQSLSGSWSGQGSARRTADGDPIGISCTMTSTSTDTSFTFNGNCRALAVIRQSFSAALNNTNGMSYEGTYVGPGGANSGLSGARSGDVINLSVAWAQEVNGDLQARMELVRNGENGLVIRTIDTSPTSGQEVVTSEVTLQRDS